jgi:hypothetical protein
VHTDNTFATAYGAGNIGADRKLTPPLAIGTDNSWRSNLDNSLTPAYWALGVSLAHNSRSFAKSAGKLLAL